MNCLDTYHSATWTVWIRTTQPYELSGYVPLSHMMNCLDTYHSATWTVWIRTTQPYELSGYVPLSHMMNCLDTYHSATWTVWIRTTQPHDELHLLCDLMFAEVVGCVRQRVDVEGSAYENEGLQVDDTQSVTEGRCWRLGLWEGGPTSRWHTVSDRGKMLKARPMIMRAYK